MLGIIKKILERKKITKLADILEVEGKINQDEKTALIGVAYICVMGFKTEEQFIEKMTDIRDLLYSFPLSEREDFKKYRRATT